MRADPERSIPSEYGMPVEVFSTCPQSSAVEKVPYKQRIADVARWSEQFGYRPGSKLGNKNRSE